MTTRAAPSPATEPEAERDDGHSGEVLDDPLPTRVERHEAARHRLERLHRAAAAGPVDEPDDRQAQLVRHLLGMDLLLEDRRVGGAAAHREVVAADDDGAAVDAGPSHDEVGGREAATSCPSSYSARPVSAPTSWNEPGSTSASMRSRTVSLPGVVLTGDLLVAAHRRGQLRAPPQLVELGIPGHDPTGRAP